METHSGYVETNEASLYYEVTGEGPAFLMVHAGIADATMWDPQSAFFRDKYRVIRFDQRGFGRTVTRTKKFNRRDDMLAVLDQLGVERAVVMGCSMGGGVALDFTLEHPERVSALILVAAGISGTPTPADLHRQWEEQDAAFVAGDLERVVELELQMWIDGPTRAPGSAAPELRAKVREMEMGNLKIDTEDYDSAPLTPPATKRLGEIRVPTLVIVGLADQPHTVDMGRRLAQEIKGAELFELQDCSHLPNLEHTDEFNRRVAEFLTEHAAEVNAATIDAPPAQPEQVGQNRGGQSGG